MTMVSILTRYKGSRDSRGSSTSNHKRSSLPYAPGTAVRLFGSGAKNRNGVRPLRSRVLTICHNIFNDYSVLWTRTKSGGYVRTRRLSLEVSFCDKYTIGEKLGSGGFGTVYAAVRNSNGAQVAIKQEARTRVSAWDKCRGQKVPAELRNLLDVQHVPGVIKLLEFYERDDSFIYVMERFNNSMDLYDFISKEKKLSEALARDFFCQVTDIVIACARSGIVHRDIKDENLLVNLDTFKLTLIDFGAGGIIKRGHYTEFDGTTVYSPPEWVSHSRYKWEGLTVWSLGCLLYCMVTGEVPFETREETAEAKLYFPSGLSAAVNSLIRGCLRLDPTERLTLTGIKTQSWVIGTEE